MRSWIHSRLYQRHCMRTAPTILRPQRSPLWFPFSLIPHNVDQTNYQKQVSQAMLVGYQGGSVGSSQVWLVVWRETSSYFAASRCWIEQQNNDINIHDDLKKKAKESKGIFKTRSGILGTINEHVTWWEDRFTPRRSPSSLIARYSSHSHSRRPIERRNCLAGFSHKLRRVSVLFLGLEDGVGFGIQFL